MGMGICRVRNMIKTRMSICPDRGEPAEDLALLGLLQLVSPALPIGAFAWSQGLESALELGWVRGRDGLAEWLGGVLEDGLSRGDLPVLQRIHVACDRADSESVSTWNDWLLASRETAELYEEDIRLGAALRRLIAQLGLLGAGKVPVPEPASYVTVFALIAHQRGVPARSAMLGFAWAWLENQLAAACKAMPLGHMAAQEIVECLRPVLPVVVDQALKLDDELLGPTVPGLALASTLHETQYSRLFRS